MPVPARKLDHQELLSEDNAANAPKEIMRLINWLMTEATSVVCGRVGVLPLVFTHWTSGLPVHLSR